MLLSTIMIPGANMIYIQVGQICFQYNLSPHLRFGNKYFCSDLLQLVDDLHYYLFKILKNVFTKLHTLKRGVPGAVPSSSHLGTLLFRGSFGFDIAFNSSASLETFCQYSLKLSSLRNCYEGFYCHACDSLPRAADFSVP